METRIEIEGMSCEHCVRAVKHALEAVPGVTGAKVEVGHAVVTSDRPIARDAIAGAIADEGYRLKS